MHPDADGPIVEQQETDMNMQISLLSDDALDIVAGGVMNDGTNYMKWVNDASADKLPWNPAFPPGGTSGTPVVPRAGGHGPVVR
jgi:hypothetical protein